jgi:hypothetical protein
VQNVVEFIQIQRKVSIGRIETGDGASLAKYVYQNITKLLTNIVKDWPIIKNISKLKRVKKHKQDARKRGWKDIIGKKKMSNDRIIPDIPEHLEKVILEMFALITKLSDAGIKASQAGANLRMTSIQMNKTELPEKPVNTLCLKRKDTLSLKRKLDL